MQYLNIIILKELQEYAQMYFSAIVEANGVDRLKPGKYSARELVDRRKCPMGEYYVLPEEDIYDEQVTIAAGDFSVEFPYREIFAVLARWEAMCKPGKLKTVFEVGTVEQKSVKVLIDEKTALGEYKTKSMKLQRVCGNWWMPAKLPKADMVELCYVLDGVAFIPGLRFHSEMLKNERESVEKRCREIGDEKIKEILASYLTRFADAGREGYGYFAEAAKRAGVGIASTASKTPEISTKPTESANGSPEEDAAERAENKPTATVIAANIQTAKGGICKGNVLHNCNLAAWDKFHKKHKDAILLFHHGGIYTAFQAEGARVAELCGVPCEINRHGAKVCQIDEAALDTLVSQGLYLAIAELTEKPDCGLSASQSVPEAVTPTAGAEKHTAGPQRLNSVVKLNLRTAPRTIKKILKVGFVSRGFAWSATKRGAGAPLSRGRAYPARRPSAYHIADVRRTAASPPGRTPPIRGDCIGRRTYHKFNYEPS